MNDEQNSLQQSGGDHNPAKSAETHRAVRARLGVLLLALGLLSTSVTLWNRYVRTSPQQVFETALKELEQNDYSAVRLKADKLRSKPGFEPHAEFLEAACLLYEGEASQALSLLSGLEDLSAELQIPTMTLQGHCYYKLQRLTEAEQIFLKILQLSRDNTQALRWLAAIYYDLGAMDTSQFYLDKLVELDPQDYTPHRLKSVIHSDFEHYDKAIASSREALIRTPPVPVAQELRLRLAKALIVKQRYSEALNELRQLPETAEVLSLIADASWALGEQEKAWKYWHQAFDLDPDDANVCKVGARLYLDIDQPRKAIPLLENVLDRSPHETEARYSLALAWRQLGEIGKFNSEMQKHQHSQKLKLQLNELSVQAMRDIRNAELRDEISELCQQLGREELAQMWRSAAQACRNFENMQKAN